MLVGYMRVSKADGSQSTDLQRDALLAAGIDAESLYEDQASGKKDDRPELAACLKALRHGDTLVVWKLDRLGPGPAPPGQHRPRPDRARHRAQGPHRPGRGHRHHHRLRQARLRDLRRPGRVRTRTDLRTHPRRPRLGPRPRPQRRPALQDDPGQTPARHGRHGQARNQGQRPLHRHRKPRPLPPCSKQSSPWRDDPGSSHRHWWPDDIPRPLPFKKDPPQSPVIVESGALPAITACPNTPQQQNRQFHGSAPGQCPASHPRQLPGWASLDCGCRPCPRRTGWTTFLLWAWQAQYSRPG